MNYESFLKQLDVILSEYKGKHGQEMSSIAELRSYLDRSKLTVKRKGLKSLKGLSI